MRKDMSKVFFERGKGSGHADSIKTSKRIHRDHIDDEDHGPSRAPSSAHRQYGWDAKGMAWYSGPFLRFLQGRIGDRWDDIYHDCCAAITTRGLDRTRLDELVSAHVALNVYMYIEGRPRWNKYGAHYVTGFYVHPETQCLCWVPQTRYRYRERIDPNVRPLTDMTELRAYEGIWYHVTYEMRPDPYTVGLLKALASKRQLSRRELKARGLSNRAA